MTWVEADPGDAPALQPLRRAPVALYTTGARNGRLAEIVLNIRPSLMRSPPRWLARFGSVRVFAGRGENEGQIRVVPGGQIVVQGSPGRQGSAPAVVIRITHLPVLAYHPSPVEVEFTHSADDLVVVLPPWLCPGSASVAASSLPKLVRPAPGGAPPPRAARAAPAFPVVQPKPLPSPAAPAVPVPAAPPDCLPAAPAFPVLEAQPVEPPAFPATPAVLDDPPEPPDADLPAFLPPAPLASRAEPGEDEDDEAEAPARGPGGARGMEDTPGGGPVFFAPPPVVRETSLHPLNPMAGLIGAGPHGPPPAAPPTRPVPAPPLLPPPTAPRPSRSPGFSMLGGAVIPTRKL